MTTTLTYTLGKFVWRELFTKDVAGAKRFYGDMFGWRAEDRPMGPDWSYTLWYNGDKQIGGMMDLAHLPAGSDHVPPHWAVYVSVADVDKAAEVAVAEGGKVLSPCMDIPNVGRFAVVQDPQGAILNLFRSAHGDPEDVSPVAHDFTWENLSTPDPAKAIAFYQKVIGWDTQQMEGDEGTMLFTRKMANGEAVPLASIGPSGDGPPNWGTFVQVADIDASLTKIQSLGAQPIVPRTEIGVGAFGLVQDPFGAFLFLYQQY